MPLNSFVLWALFPVVFCVYWCVPARHNRLRNIFLLLVSYLFYINWKPAFAFALIGITIITYLGGLIISSDKSRKRKGLVITFTILSLLPLLVFKYYNFINDSIYTVLEQFGLRFKLPGLNWAIPVGLSFYSFQALGYLLDVYNDRCPGERDFLDYALFVGFFPQIASGPISTASELLPQIKRPRVFSFEQGRKGLEMILYGLLMKSVIADRFGLYVDTVFVNFEHFSAINCIIAAVLFSIQIYADFAGYSLMAVGFASLLGLNLINNFERPYFAASITEFWKRWHISLTRWLTTHIYISLGGNRCSKLKQYFNILVTFLVSGLWHGANWTFIIWGAIHGSIQIIEKALFGQRIRNEIKNKSRSFSVSRASVSSHGRLMQMAICFARVDLPAPMKPVM